MLCPDRLWLPLSVTVASAARGRLISSWVSFCVSLLATTLISAFPFDFSKAGVPGGAQGLLRALLRESACAWRDCGACGGGGRTGSDACKASAQPPHCTVSAACPLMKFPARVRPLLSPASQVILPHQIWYRKSPYRACGHCAGPRQPARSSLLAPHSVVQHCV